MWEIRRKSKRKEGKESCRLIKARFDTHKDRENSDEHEQQRWWWQEEEEEQQQQGHEQGQGQEEGRNQHQHQHQHQEDQQPQRCYSRREDLWLVRLE